MYCNQCGNILQEGSLFCSFCGAKNNASEQTPAAVQEISRPVSEPVLSEAAPVVPATPVEEQHNEPTQAMFTTEAEMPRMAPNFGGTVPVKKEKPPKAEKYYTFGHIMLCLSAVAVMAIVAGVFAGLYFSVV